MGCAHAWLPCCAGRLLRRPPRQRSVSVAWSMSGMVQTEPEPFASKPLMVDGLMRLRRNVMLGCLGLLFLAAASGISPLDAIDAASGPLVASSQPGTLAQVDGGGLFRPFGDSDFRQSGGQLLVRGQTDGVPTICQPGGCLPFRGECCATVASLGRPVSPSQLRCGLANSWGSCGPKAREALNTTFASSGIHPEWYQTLSNISKAPYIQSRLQEAGVGQYRLEPWGLDGGVYRFWCKVPLGDSAPVTRYFEAIDRNPGEAVARVLAQIEAWRRGG